MLHNVAKAVEHSAEKNRYRYQKKSYNKQKKSFFVKHNPNMELKEFIKAAITDITEAISELQSGLDNGAIINPPQMGA